MDFLLNLDLQMFRAVNYGMANPIMDFIMPIITREKFLLPVYILGLVLLAWKGGRKGRIVAIVLVVGAIISDQLSSNLIKDLVGRLRPCQNLVDLRLLVPCGSGKSFPSSHSVNNFAAAIVLMHYYRKYTAVFLVVASIVAFSRIYVGVHYPLDVLGGAIIGSLIGMLVVLLKNLINKQYKFE